MSDEARRKRQFNILVMEQEEKISACQHAKVSIRRRIAEKENAIIDEKESLALQDVEIEKAQAEIDRLKKSMGEGG